MYRSPLHAPHPLLRALGLALLVTASTLIGPAAHAQECLSNVILTSQAEVDAFACSVQGNLLIVTSDGSADPITSLGGFAGLTSVGLTLSIGNNAALESLAEGSFEAGRHEVRFAASSLPSGSYLVRMTTENGFTQTRRLALVR